MWVSVTFPYIRGLSQSIRRALSSLAIKVTFCPLRTLRQELVHPKDPIPEWQRKGVVYRVLCSECLQVYIGQTDRSLDHRIVKHRWALRNGDVVALTLAEHELTTGHKMDLSKATVMMSTLMPRLTSFLSPDTSSMNRSLSTGEGELC